MSEMERGIECEDGWVEVEVVSSKWYATERMACDRQENKQTRKQQRVAVKFSFRPDSHLVKDVVVRDRCVG